MKLATGSLARGLAAALALTFAGGASAATQVFSGLDNSDLSGGGPRPNAEAARGQFSAAAGVLLTQTFEDLTGIEVPTTLAAPFGVAIDVPIAVSASLASGVNPFQTYAASGGYIDAIAPNGSAFYTFTFDVPTRAIGFDLTDSSDWAGDSRPASHLVLTLVTSGGNLDFQLFDSTPANAMVSGNFGFFGVVSDAQDILGFTITNPAGNPDADALGLDNLSYAIEPVPLPGSAWLMLSAVAGAAGITRRQRRA